MKRKDQGVTLFYLRGKYIPKNIVSVHMDMCQEQTTGTEETFFLVKESCCSTIYYGRKFSYWRNNKIKKEIKMDKKTELLFLKQELTNDLKKEWQKFVTTAEIAYCITEK